MKVHDGGNGVGPHLVCGDVSGGEYGIAPGGKLTSGEKWSVACAVEECDDGENVDGDVENDVENVVENVSVGVGGWEWRFGGSGKEVHEMKKVQVAEEDQVRELVPEGAAQVESVRRIERLQ